MLGKILHEFIRPENDLYKMNQYKSMSNQINSLSQQILQNQSLMGVSSLKLKPFPTNFFEEYIKKEQEDKAKFEAYDENIKVIVKELKACDLYGSLVHMLPGKSIDLQFAEILEKHIKNIKFSKKMEDLIKEET